MRMFLWLLIVHGSLAVCVTNSQEGGEENSKIGYREYAKMYKLYKYKADGITNRFLFNYAQSAIIAGERKQAKRILSLIDDNPDRMKLLSDDEVIEMLLLKLMSPGVYSEKELNDLIGSLEIAVGASKVSPSWKSIGTKSILRFKKAEKQ